MRYRLIFIVVVIMAVAAVAYVWWEFRAGYDTDERTLAAGRKLFTNYCVGCHGIQEDGIGPPLGGVTAALEESDLTSFIRDPASALAGGNARARALLARYKQTMPSFDWMHDDSLHAILSYIDHESKRFGIMKPISFHSPSAVKAMTGKLVSPVVDSGIKLELKDVIQIPRLKYSTPDLGIVTLRPHPSGDGRLFVSDQGGVIYEISGDRAEIFLDLRDHIPDFSIGPGLATGLGSFDFHPDYLNNGLLYITHAEKFDGQRADYSVSDSVMSEVQWVLGEWKLNDINSHVFKGSRRELLRLHSPTFGHSAQDLAFAPDLKADEADYGMLYWGFGDGGSNNIRMPQLGHHPRSFLGTILRIDPLGKNSKNGKYGVPDDNPFVSVDDTLSLKEIYAYGFRNPHRMAWDPAHTNRMIVTDIGESNIEEINLVRKGGDYGWPNREGEFGISTLRDLKTVYRPPPSDKDLYLGPFAQYDHTEGFAISGGYVYDGPIALLRNKYVFGDIVNGRLFFVKMDSSLSDSTVYELKIVQSGRETNLREMSGIRRLHLRVAYDRFSKRLYVITKSDGMIRTVVHAYQ